MMKIKDVTILEIEGMTAGDCVGRVTAALHGLAGVRTESVTIGSATIDCDNKVTFHSACKAVSAAGFKIRRAAAPVRPHEAAHVPHAGAGAHVPPAHGTTGANGASGTNGNL